MAHRTFLLDEDGDMAVDNGHWVIAADAEAVTQDIEIRLGFFLGEWFLDEEIGVPWLQRILQKGTPAEEVREHLRVAIASAPDVTEVAGANLELDAATRQASISYTVQTSYGEATAAAEVSI